MNILAIIDSISAINPMLAAVIDTIKMDESIRFLGIKLINSSDFAELLFRFAFNTLVIFSIVHFMYAKNSNRKDYYFSYLSIGVIVFLLSFLLSNVKMELGFALGLFAIFGIIRYRTDTIPIKEMTYLFVIIGVSVINALANKKVSYMELFLTNGIIVAGLWYLEKKLMMREEQSIHLIYEKIENINTKNHNELLEDLINRTGLDIKRFEIKKIDFLKDVAEITLYCHTNGHIKN